MHRINIQRVVEAPFIPASSQFKQWARCTLKEKISAAEITIRIVDPQEITELNATYRNKNKPTNVLSFPIPIPAEFNDEVPMLGDIIICAQVIQQEALHQRKTLAAHWAHMIVHGTLHLLGYDHENDDDAFTMEQEEIRLLKTLGFTNPYIMAAKGNPA